jgi:hypothetical protein
MTDPLRELLRKARDRLDSYVFVGVGSKPDAELIARIDAALAQQPEPVAHALTSEFDKLKDPDCLSISVLMFRHGSRLNPTTAIYAVPPSAAVLIAEKDAEIERLRRACEFHSTPPDERALAQIKEAKAVAYIEKFANGNEHLGYASEPENPAAVSRRYLFDAVPQPSPDTKPVAWRYCGNYGATTYSSYDPSTIEPPSMPCKWQPLYAAPQPPASSNQENAGRETRQPEETRGLLGASELSGDEHQIDDPQQVGSQPLAGKGPEPHYTVLLGKIAELEEQWRDIGSICASGWTRDNEARSPNEWAEALLHDRDELREKLADAIPREIHDRLVREKDAKIEQLRSALEGVVRVADRKTVEFDAARAALAFEHELEESPQTAAQLHDWHKRRKPTGNQP